MKYIIRGKKLVTVSNAGTIENGALLIQDGIIKEVGPWENLIKQFPEIEVIDCSNQVITPSLVDCHTHLLEFAPTSLYPVTPETHFLAGKAILFTALSSGITALGEQICGHPLCNFSIKDYRDSVADFPMDISFATTSISIGFEELAHFTSITGSTPVSQRDLSSPSLIKKMAENSDYPGENLFINATPANFTEDVVPRAGEIIYRPQELKEIVSIYHSAGKKIGCHVAGKEGIEMAIEAGFDVLHHAHGITDKQIDKVAEKGIQIVATPMGGTHLSPNSPEEIVRLVEKNIPVSISTDAYLPPYPGVAWLAFQDRSLKGPDSLILIASPSMKLLKNSYNENEVLALLTSNPARILGKEKQFGRLEPGLEANLLVAEGIPGIEITDVEQIKKVFYKGLKVIDRG
ncbi:amidohydrolase family protein [Bacillus sp. REN16]|uniref:amidohydrolase family protein n=1 Tax=Bacillus sp. REN16 TaxID=2887296 RepID=UPI001E5D3F8F|nr:amidohydrolase family protein [Bacillus sp. REN16]MCC3359214.1 amidohydrolase family protein [Bacillus sp. REN16]